MLHPLGEGRRVPVAGEQVDVRLAAARTRRRRRGRRGGRDHAVISEESALPWTVTRSSFLEMSGTQRLARTTSPATVDMPRCASLQLDFTVNWQE